VSVRWDVEQINLDPQFGEDIDALLARSTFAWAVVQGFRTKEYQGQLWDKYQAGGPLAAPPGRSAHMLRTIKSICAPACEAEYSASMMSGSIRLLTLMMIRPPGLASRSISCVMPARKLVGATMSLR